MSAKEDILTKAGFLVVNLAQRMAVSRLIDQTGDAVQKANTRHGGRNNRK